MEKTEKGYNEGKGSAVATEKRNKDGRTGQNSRWKNKSGLETK